MDAHQIPSTQSQVGQVSPNTSCRTYADLRNVTMWELGVLDSIQCSNNNGRANLFSALHVWQVMLVPSQQQLSRTLYIQPTLPLRQ